MRGSNGVIIVNNNSAQCTRHADIYEASLSRYIAETDTLNSSWDCYPLRNQLFH